MKEIDLKRSVHDLARDYPELVDILIELGFKDISKPGMLNTAGRVMTLPMGARMKRIELATLIERLNASSFTVINQD